MSSPQTQALTGKGAGLDETNLCGAIDDFHSTLSRVVIGILLRSYLDTYVLTPLEIIHLAKPLRRLAEQVTLVENSILRVANAQGAMPGHSASQRRVVIRRAVDETLARALAAQKAFAGMAHGAGMLDRVLDAAGGRSPTGNPVYDRRYAMAAELAVVHTWAEKLDLVLDRLRDERTRPIADEALADLLGGTAVMDLLFGPAAATDGTLVTRLSTLVFGEETGSATLIELNRLFHQGQLPETRMATLDRIRRLLRAPFPLGRGQPGEEADALQSVLPLLITPSGVVGGERTAEALTIRYSRRLEQGGASAFRRSVVGLAETLPDFFCRSHFLAAVARVPAATRHLDEIAHTLGAAFSSDLLIENLLGRAEDFERLRWILTGAQEAVRSSPLPGRERLADRMAGLFDENARNGRLFVHLRQAEPSPRRRVLKLAELAICGLVTETGGLPAVWKTVQEAIRQTDFQKDLGEASGSDEAEAEVRLLHELLGRLRRILPEKDAAASLASFSVPTRPAARAPMALVGKQGEGPGRCPYCFDESYEGACRACGYPKSIDNRPGVHLMPGAVLRQRYQVGRLLGQGGFGSTYLGWDLKLECKVAVKEYYPANLVSRPPGGERVAPFSDLHAESYALGLSKFLEEARLLARLREIKEIVVIHDFFEENATAYLVMELLQGRTFKRYITDCGGSIDARRTLTILAPIMKALQAVHDRGLIHRDVSPDNIFLLTNGERKLLDFGAARHAVSMGQGLTVILKPGYAPPEQYSPDSQQGPWTDVYAMCATIYCALTGKLPPDATSRFMKDNVPSLGELGVNAPPAFEKALFAGLSMKAASRPQSMRDLLRTLSAGLG